MTLDNLETQYQQALSETLDNLQTVNLLVAQIEAKMDEVRNSMQSLCQIGEKLVVRRKRLINRETRKKIYILKSRNSS